MKATIEDRPGRALLDLRPGTGTYRIDMTTHDLDDLLAVLEQHKAMGRYCDAEDGQHTCVMPPGHSILPHVCRACPRQWRTPIPVPVIPDDRMAPGTAAIVSTRPGPP